MSRIAQRNAASDDGDLGRLLAAEARLETMLADARAEAARLVAEARAAAAARETGLDAEIEREAAALDARLSAERAGREAEIAAQAEASARRYDAIGQPRVGALAARVVERLVAAS
jgi:vacuolar-type H+-ATPase subunit H